MGLVTETREAWESLECTPLSPPGGNVAHCLDLSSPSTFPGRSGQLHSSVWAESNTGHEHRMGQVAFLKSFL